MNYQLGAALGVIESRGISKLITVRTNVKDLSINSEESYQLQLIK